MWPQQRPQELLLFNQNFESKKQKEMIKMSHYQPDLGGNRPHRLPGAIFSIPFTVGGTGANQELVVATSPPLLRRHLGASTEETQKH